MLKGKIEFTGRTLQDVQDAVDEAVTRMWAEMTSGFDSNEDGSFTFEIEEQKEN